MDAVSPFNGNGNENLYLFERVSGEVYLISQAVDDNSSGADQDIEFATISADGRYIALVSSARNLVNATFPSFGSNIQVYLYDIAAGVMTLVTHKIGDSSQASDIGIQFEEASISADGRYLAYYTLANDVSSDTTLNTKIIIYDRVTDTNILASPRFDDPSVAASSALPHPRISDDGRRVVFYSGANDLLANGASSGRGNIFLRDLDAATTTLVSRQHGVTPAAESDTAPDSLIFTISGDGSAVAFLSNASDIRGTDNNDNQSDLFRFDVGSGNIDLVTHLASDTEQSSFDGGTAFSSAAFSADGSKLAFWSGASDLVAGQASGSSAGEDVFVYDYPSRQNTLVSHDVSDPTLESASISDSARISTDGRYIVFRSLARTLVDPPTSVSPAQVFLYELASGSNRYISSAANGAMPDGEADFAYISATGTWVAFFSSSTNLVNGQEDNNSGRDIFLFSTGITAKQAGFGYRTHKRVISSSRP